MDDLSSPNKAVRRNGLKKILEEVKGENFVKDDHLLPFFSKLLYSDEYDTSRELSFQIVSSAWIRSSCRQSSCLIMLKNKNEIVFQNSALKLWKSKWWRSLTFRNVLNQKSNETEAVRICVYIFLLFGCRYRNYWHCYSHKAATHSSFVTSM